MINLKFLLCIFLLSIITACSSKLLTVHKIDVQQGNALEAEMVDKIEIGMTQEQVHYVLGSPLITDSFHPDRWDYIYLFRPGYGKKERRQLTLTFDRGEIIEIDKDNIIKNEADNIITDDVSEIKKENKEKTAKGQLTKKDQKEFEEAEKEADSLKRVLEENKNPGN